MKNYDPPKLSIYISYPDMNNFYVWAVGDYLPCCRFKLLKNVDKFDVNSISKNNPVGYILEADLKYPDDVHVLHNDYPLAAEKLAISYDMLSDYFKNVPDEYRKKVGDVMKLISNLANKTNYVLHYKNIQLYLSLGMKLTKIPQVLKFKQSDWMKKYINFNTEKRADAANSFEKDFLKLMINSVYVKTMKNL